MKKMKTIRAKAALMLALSFLLTAVPVPDAVEQVQAAVKLSNPVVKNSEDDRKREWDCIWFGSYPQAEIITWDAYKDYGPLYRYLYGWWTEYSFMEPDDALHQELEDADGWDASGDITIRGIRYHRVLWKDMAGAKAHSASKYSLKTKPEAESYSYTDQDFTAIDWKDSKTYRYFRYDPIKWRVLHTDGKKALLLSDLAIDCFGYSKEKSSKWSLDMRWEKSIFRKWLNGYQMEKPAGVYMTEGNFINRAFSKKEQKKILTTKLSNKDNSLTGADAGKDTKDKVFLLAEEDVFSENGYGLKSYSDISSTGYAVAAGTGNVTAGDEGWLLRTPGDEADIPMAVENYGGDKYLYGRPGYGLYQIRPAITLDLTANKLWDYAGKMGADAFYAPENLTGKIAITGSVDKLLAGKKLKLGVVEFPFGAEGEKIVWSCSNRKYASVSQKGVVTAKKAGIGRTVTVTARMQGKNNVQAKCKIRIVKDSVKSIKLSSKKGSKIIEGVPLQLSANVKTTGKTAGKGLVWSSSNKKYASVTPEGTVMARKAGIGKTVTITARAADRSGVSAKYKLTIIEDKILNISLVSPKEQKAALGSRVNIKVKVKRRSGTLTGIQAARLLDWSAEPKKWDVWCRCGHVRCDKKGTITVTAKGGKKKVKAVVKVK